MRKFILAAISILSIGLAASLANNYQVTQGSGTNFGSVSAININYPMFIVCDNTTPTNCAVVSAGALGVSAIANQGGTWNITNISGTITLPTGASTSVAQASQIALETTIANNTGAAIPAGTNPIGQVSSITLLGTFAGWTGSVQAALASSITLVKATQGVVGGAYCYNSSGAVAYLQIFNTTPVTLGTTVPIQSYGVPTVNAGGITIPPPGLFAVTAITVASTTTAKGVTGVAMDCNILFN